MFNGTIDLCLNGAERKIRSIGLLLVVFRADMPADRQNVIGLILKLL